MTPARHRLSLVLALLVALAGAPALAANETLQEAQNILLMLGYHPGRSDGNLRPATTKALTEFQHANQLPANGKLDDRTMAALRQVRDTKFAHSLNGPRPAEERRPQVEPHPIAQPVDRVAAAPVENAPGTRVLGGSTNLASAAGIPPALFGGGTSSSSSLTTPPPLSSDVPPPPPSAPDRPPFLGIASWNWILPFLGIPLFGFLWWYGMRRQAVEPETETAELMQARREPNMERGAPPTQGRREPSL